ncbi:Gfo/Idh/MocA family oxidoreductase [Actinocorallia aurea]
MKGPVAVGVLGCADIARRRVLPAFAAEPAARIAAVASRSGERARRVARSYGCAAVTGYDALLADPDIEAVYVPLPIALHAEWIERALLAGKHVLGEKPLTDDPDETARLFALARSRGLVLAENFMFPHHRLHRTIRRLVAEGSVGQPLSFTGAFGIPPPAAGDIRYRAELGGGALLDVAVQPLLAALTHLGDGLEVRGAALRRHPVHKVDTGGSILLAAPGGATAQIVFGMDHFYRAALEIWGAKGRLTVERPYAPPADHRPVIALSGHGGQREITVDADDQGRNAVRAFCAAVRGACEPPRPDQSLALIRLAADVRAAAADGVPFESGRA